MAKIHGITGAHRISTGLRIRTQPPGSATPAPRANTFSPDLQAIQKLPTQPESPRHTLHQSPDPFKSPLDQADQDSPSRSHGLQDSLWAPSAQRKRRRSISPDHRAVRAQFTSQYFALAEEQAPEPSEPRPRSRACTESSVGSIDSLPSIRDLITAAADCPAPLPSPGGLGAFQSLEEPPQSLEVPETGSEASDEAPTPPSGQGQLPGKTGPFLPSEPSQSSLSPPDELELQHQKALKPLLEKSSIRALIAYSKVPIPAERLHARQARLFSEAAKRAADAFLRAPTTNHLLHLLLLPRVLGIALLKGNFAPTLRAFPRTIPPPPKDQTDLPYTGQQDPAKRAAQLLERGFLGKASRTLLDPAPTAPNTARTRAALRAKHPVGAPEPFKARSRPRPGQPVTKEAISAAITSIGKEKAPGLSGWTRGLLEIATSAPDASILSALRLLADMIRQGTAPGADLLCAARLVGLQKPDGGIRPIAVGDILYRVALKALLATNFQPGMLLPNQLGVGNPGGVEPAITLLQEVISGPNASEIHTIASLDLSNAFNTMPRTAVAAAIARYAPGFYRAAEWAYGRPGLLITADGTAVASAEGVRQGDPLAGFLFSLAIRPTLEALQETLPQALIIAYFDDIYLLNKGPESPLQAATEVLAGSPVTLNLSKSSEHPVASLKTQGLKALGTLIGPVSARRQFLQGKINALEEALDALKALPKQHALLLLRGSIQLLLRHLLRQLEPEGLEDLWEKTDALIYNAIQSLASRAPTGYDRAPEAINSSLIALPVREGGLGVPLHTDLAVPLYTAAQAEARVQLYRIFGTNANYASPDPGPPDQTAQQAFQSVTLQRLQLLDQALDQPQHRAWQENSSYLGRRWLNTLPTAKGITFTDPEATEALRARLLLPVRPPETPCNYCAAEAALGHEDLCKGASRRWLARHNQITRAFEKTLTSRPDLEFELEPHIPGQAPEAPVPQAPPRADFAVTLGNTRYFYDVQIVAINKQSARTEAAATLQEAAAEKQRKYKGLGHCFKPLIVSAGGLMEKETAQTYKGLQRLIGSVAAAWLDSQISYTLVKTRAISAASIARDIPLRN